MKKPGSVLRKKAVAIPILFAITFPFLWYAVQTVASLFSAQLSKGKAALIAAGISIAFVLMANLPRNRAYKGAEYGSAQWGSKAQAKQYRDKQFSENILLSENVRLSMDGMQTRLNNHVLIAGGSGSGKSRFYVIPNMMQMNASYIVTDPSGELLRATGKMLAENGYQIKVFDAGSLKNGMQFNPFAYFREIKDIRRYVDMLIANTTGDTGNAQHNEDFWVKSERLWLMAHMAYLFETCRPHERNMPNVVRLLDESSASEEDETQVSPIDILFEELERANPESFAAKQYKKYKLAADIICSKRYLNHVCSHG